MFENNNKSLYTQHSQIYTKRDRFRIQIRRRSIQQYQQRIRKQWQQQENQMMSVPKHNQVSFQLQQHFRTDSNKQQFRQHNISFNPEYLQSKKLNQVACQLQQLVLTHPQNLCHSKNLSIVSQIISNLYFYEKSAQEPQIKSKIKKILCKICVNEIYWSQQFLIDFINLLKNMNRSKCQILQHILCISEFNIPQLKIMAYQFLMSKGFLQQIRFQYSEAHKKQSIILQILANFITQPPIVPNKTNYIEMDLEQNQYSQKYYISKLLSLLLTIITQNNHAQMLSLIYALLIRNQCKQLHIILKILNEQKWQILHMLLQSQSISKNENSVNEVKAKFKILQISKCIIEFGMKNSQCRSICLSYFYTFLPTLLTMITTDLQNYMTNPPSPKYYNYSSLQQKYELLLLQFLIPLLTLKDQLDNSPALQFINTRFPHIIQKLFSHFYLHQYMLKDAKKLRVILWIFQIIISQNNVCRLDWLNYFTRAVINMEIQTWQRNNYRLLSQFFDSLLYIINNHEHQSYEGCRLLYTLSESQIVYKLQYLQKQMEDSSCESMASSIKSILNIIQNCSH